jgi:hypothetical protein
VPVERQETLYWKDYPAALSRSPEVAVYPTPYCGYYGAMRDRIIELAALVADLGADLVQYGALLDADPARLAEVEDRRALLTRLTRKYGPELTDVLAWAEEAERQLVDLDVSDEALAALAAERDALAAETAKLGSALSAARHNAADRLASAITAELAGLAMPDARVTVTVASRTGAGASLIVDGAQPLLARTGSTRSRSAATTSRAPARPGSAEHQGRAVSRHAGHRGVPR